MNTNEQHFLQLVARNRLPRVAMIIINAFQPTVRRAWLGGYTTYYAYTFPRLRLRIYEPA